MSPQSSGRTIGYIRVSTEDQRDGRSLPYQTAQLEASGVDEIYCDIESGANVMRPNFVRLIDEVTRGEIGTIKVIRWDRLTRNSDEFPMLKKTLRKYKIKLVVLEQGGEQDLSTASGEFSADMQVLFAAYERTLIRDRIRNVMTQRRSEKCAWTRPPLFYDILGKNYTLSNVPCVCSLEDRPNNYSEYDENTLLENLLRGQSKRDIAEELVKALIELRRFRPVLIRVHSRYTLAHYRNPSLVPGIAIFSSTEGLKSWLQNPVLRGHTAYLKYDSARQIKDPDEWELHLDTHPNSKLFDDSFYEDEVQILLESNSKRFGKVDATTYLTKFVFCDKCASKCVLKSGNKYKYYSCRHSGVCCTNEKCVRVDDIDEAIIFKLTERARSISQSSHQSEPLLKSDRLKSLEENLAWIESAPDFSTNYKVQQEQKQLLRNIELEKSKSNEIARQMLCSPQACKVNFWYSLPEALREIFYDTLLDKVLIANEVVSVSLKI